MWLSMQISILRQSYIPYDIKYKIKFQTRTTIYICIGFKYNKKKLTIDINTYIH